nr:poly(ADP-ribose) glycohydrolase [Halyomorpha halys]
MSGLDSSHDMFEDSNVSEGSGIFEAPWCGVPLDELKGKNVFDSLQPVRPSPTHIVCFKLPLIDGRRPVPFPETFNDKWDTIHVRMPQSPQSLFPVSENELKPRWQLVKSAFTKGIKCSNDLEAAIFSYNSKNSQKWSFDALHQFFSETLAPEESSYFFSNIFPDIVKLALEVETAFKSGIPFLKKGESKSISISQEQAGILLANAFLSTFPRRNSPTQYSKYPTINFNRLFQCGSLRSVQEKLKCFVNYFRRICKKRPEGVITYTRRHINPNALPIWSSIDKTLPKLHISSEGTIEDEGSGLIEIDFANKFIGGGVLGRGSVQEEIKFLICPELVVARLFTEVLDDTEAVIVIGLYSIRNINTIFPSYFYTIEQKRKHGFNHSQSLHEFKYVHNYALVWNSDHLVYVLFNMVAFFIGALWKLLGSYGRKINSDSSRISVFEHIYEEMDKVRGISKEPELNDAIMEKEDNGAETERNLSGIQKEPVPGESCSLTTEEGRKKCLETEAARWDAYRAAMNAYGSPRTPVKRKISDYFQKTEK